jgi:hypothetical protein
MPVPCFSYPANGPTGSEGRHVARPNLRDPRRMPHSCFGYVADTPRSMPFACFSYPADVPLDARRPDAAPPGLRKMPISICFRY